jgi:microcystin-dependent protein
MDGFIGEVRAFSWNWPPEGWLFCNGSAVPQQQQQALYAVIGNQFGGSGSNFNLPNLMGRAPMGAGAGPGLTPRTVGAPVNGAESVTVTSTQMPAHSHDMVVQQPTGTTGMTSGPTANTSMLSRTFSGNGNNTCKDFVSSTTMAPNTTLPPTTLAQTGAGGAHENRQPYLALNFCICINGVFPIRP